MSEVDIALLLCGLLAGGEVETRRHFEAVGEARHVRVDCETDRHVIEIGLDKASSRDSLHQAIFAAELTGKTPLVILIDRDGVEGRYEYETRRVAARVGVGYARCAGHVVERWRATQPWRDAVAGWDVPRAGPVRSLCDLASLATDAGG
ncbi:hypothetical protein ROJ8625_02444 [Roseivivax jejudonensis]|uniref:Uncharacterized protein n=1 Tax=Roseivivax jejudonensis TaxID=1529041 RepID=A0A1X6ZFT3_9RHOB|nr:hypothetical protein [Roseivivax jejudonensis]SLN49710.1 hypothetical protein ROJ8625_02444 [Roseivivax jejudonensis]